MAIRATRFMEKPTTVRQKKRTLLLAVSGAVLLIVLAALRFTILEPAFEPFPIDETRPTPPPAAPTVLNKTLSIEELERQAIINNPRPDTMKH